MTISVSPGVQTSFAPAISNASGLGRALINSSATSAFLQKFTPALMASLCSSIA